MSGGLILPGDDNYEPPKWVRNKRRARQGGVVRKQGPTLNIPDCPKCAKKGESHRLEHDRRYDHDNAFRFECPSCGTGFISVTTIPASVRAQVLNT